MEETEKMMGRGRNEFAREHMEDRWQLYLMSRRVTAVEETAVIPFMEGYFDQQVAPDYVHDCREWWEVIDRTTGELVDARRWHVDQERHVVTVEHAAAFHEYTVSFLAFAVWDPTQMYNHIASDWGDKPHENPFDARRPASGQYARDCLVRWLKDNPGTDVVRFTTFFYHFTGVFNSQAKEKPADRIGCGAAVSVKALLEFEQEYGYRLRPEDLVDNGYYSSIFRIPSKHHLDYLGFIQRFAAGKARELVELVHQAGREAVMFLGDNWIGTEPYGAYFPEIGLDGVAGSVGGGAALRFISDILGVRFTEGCLLPCFFPDAFCGGNDPCAEAKENWLCARRALMRKPVDRIGCGGHLSLACKFPEFADYMEQVADEFRQIYDNIGGSRPYCGLKVAVLNCWGRFRAWQTFMAARALRHKQTCSYFGVLEALSGAAVDVVFMSFDDIRNNGIPEDVQVIINAGAAGTAFSGGEEWLDDRIVTAVRRFVCNGGGFVGIGEPSAVHHGGRYFQLADVLGVDEELGFGLWRDKYFTEMAEGHFLEEDRIPPYDFGEGVRNVYALSEETEIVDFCDGEVRLSAHSYGRGRGVYMAGLPYSLDNTMLLLRSLYYSAGKEQEMKRWHSDNPLCEVHAYPETGKYAVLNNCRVPQPTTVYDGEGRKTEMRLEGGQILWKTI